MADVLGLVGNPWAYTFNPAGTLLVNNVALDATGDKTGWIIQVPEAATITQLGFRYGARTGTPPTYKIGLQGVGLTTGLPDGTYKGGGSPASATFTPPADTTWNGTIQWITLANAYVAARGEALAIVIEHSSGTVDGSNNGSIGQYGTRLVASGRLGGMPYPVQNLTGSWAILADVPSLVGYRTASRAYGFLFQTADETVYSSNSSPNERGMRFKLPAGLNATYSVLGVRAVGDPGEAGKSLRVVLYDTDGTTELQTVVLDCDLSPGTNTARSTIVLFDATTLAVLQPGSAYRVGITPQEVSSGFAIFRLTSFPAASDLSMFAGGIEFYACERTRTNLASPDTAAWTDVATERPEIELIINDITGAAAGGGGMRLAGHGGLAA